MRGCWEEAGGLRTAQTSKTATLHPACFGVSYLHRFHPMGLGIQGTFWGHLGDKRDCSSVRVFLFAAYFSYCSLFPQPGTGAMEMSCLPRAHLLAAGVTFRLLPAHRSWCWQHAWVR